MIHLGQDLFLFGFSSAESETAFRRSHHNPREARKIILIGLLIYTLYLFQDYFLFPEYFNTIVFIRLGIILPVLLILFFLTHSRWYHRLSVVIFIGLAFFSAAGIIMIEYLVRGSAYAEMYFYGIAQVLIVFYGTGKVKFLPAVICGLLIIVPAVVVDALWVETDIHRIVTKTIFISTMLSLGVIVSSIIQRAARLRFLSQCQTEELSLTDHLTGLRNRLFYQKFIVDEILGYVNSNHLRRSGRNDRISDSIEPGCYALILLDIDFFKRINDSYGHQAGDRVLTEFSRRMLSIIRSDDVLIRWGGEEFLLLLRNSRMEHIELLVNRIRQGISEKLFVIGEYSEQITVSGGIQVIYPDSAEDLKSIDMFLKSADKALYFSKNNGRNCFTNITAEGKGLERRETFKLLKSENVVL